MPICTFVRLGILTGLTSTPALDLPGYRLPFHTHVHEKDGFTSGILVRKHSSHYCSVALYSSKLPPVVQGMPACLRAVAATAILTEKSPPTAIGSTSKAFVPYSVLCIPNTLDTRQMTAACRSGYEANIISSSNIYVHKAPL